MRRKRCRNRTGETLCFSWQAVRRHISRPASRSATLPRRPPPGTRHPNARPPSRSTPARTLTTCSPPLLCRGHARLPFASPLARQLITFRPSTARQFSACLLAPRSPVQARARPSVQFTRTGAMPRLGPGLVGCPARAPLSVQAPCAAARPGPCTSVRALDLCAARSYAASRCTRCVCRAATATPAGETPVQGGHCGDSQGEAPTTGAQPANALC